MLEGLKKSALDAYEAAAATKPDYATLQVPSPTGLQLHSIRRSGCSCKLTVMAVTRCPAQLCVGGAGGLDPANQWVRAWYAGLTAIPGTPARTRLLRHPLLRSLIEVQSVRGVTPPPICQA